MARINGAASPSSESADLKATSTQTANGAGYSRYRVDLLLFAQLRQGL